MKFNYKWSLADGFPAKGITQTDYRVFGTFLCGGGSSMGYKLAGLRHLGGVEIDQRCADIYRKNLQPGYLFVEDLRDFNKREDLPAELYQLDILDGSPPCSTFSMNGKREKGWGVQKKFAEGQALQRLDDLVFVYVETIAKLRPKTFVLENVSGLIKGNAKVYAKMIVERVKEAGYDVQLFLLDSSRMGVPQVRQRCFFLGRRNDLGLPPIRLDFQDAPILFGKIMERGCLDIDRRYEAVWRERSNKDGSVADMRMRESGRLSGFSQSLAKVDKVCPTITCGEQYLLDYPRKLTNAEVKFAGSFPVDYDCPDSKLKFLVGMSVPPVMMARVAYEMREQWLSRLSR